MFRARLSRRLALVADPTLVALPPGVGTVLVYRHAVSAAAEQRIVEELAPLLHREGQRHYADHILNFPAAAEANRAAAAASASAAAAQQASGGGARVVRSVYLDMLGRRPWFEADDEAQGKTRRLPGLVWSPALVAAIDAFGGSELLTAHSRPLRVSDEGSSDGDKIGGNAPLRLAPVPVDAARVTEHQLPGAEMHVEPATSGAAFLMLNLLGDTLLDFDDEATQRRGQVLLPQRSLMLCAGEARWGWRWGEAPTAAARTFVNAAAGLRRRVEPDLRLTVQLWHFDLRLLDRRALLDVATALGARVTAAAAEREAAAAAGEAPGLATAATAAVAPPTAAVGAVGAATGPLGGDAAAGTGDAEAAAQRHAIAGRPAPRTMGEIGRDALRAREHFDRIGGLFKEFNRRSEPGGGGVTPEWFEEVRQQMAASGDAAAPLPDNYDPENPLPAWDAMSGKARYYRRRLKSMSYDSYSGGSSDAREAEAEAEAEEAAQEAMAPEADLRAVVQKMQRQFGDTAKALGGNPGPFGGSGAPSR